MDDPWYTYFQFTVTLTNVPASANYKFTVGKVDTSGELYDTQSEFGNGPFSFYVDGVAGEEDAGMYGVMIEAIGGADCQETYLFTASS